MAMKMDGKGKPDDSIEKRSGNYTYRVYSLGEVNKFLLIS